MKTRYLFALSIGCLLGLGACTEKVSDEEILWEYYKGFTYAPGLFDSLKQVVTNPETKSFLMGLRCFEKYSQDKKADCYDSARVIFEDLIKNYPDSYLGYLGKGILLTERGKFTNERILFDSAKSFYQLAKLKQPGHPAIYYYFGRNEYNADKKTISVEAIQLLDTAILLKPDFFKANERSAEFLSHYLDLANAVKAGIGGTGTKVMDLQRFEIIFPQAENRIRYLFNASLVLDSSWQETYEGIAKAHRVYSAHDRIQYMEKAIQIAKRKKVDSIELIMTITDLHFSDLNDYDNAIRYYNSWIDAFGSPMDFANRGWCYYYLKDKQKASNNFRRAVKSGNPEPQFQLAQYYKLEHEYDSSLFYLNKILAGKGGNTKLYQIAKVEKAKLLIALKKESEARSILQDIEANSDGNHYEVLYNARTLLASMAGK